MKAWAVFELKKMIKNTETISVYVQELDEAVLSDIKELPHVYDVKYASNLLEIKYSGGQHNLVRVLDYFKQNEISFGKVYSEHPTLNDVFLEITGKELRD